MTPPEYLNADQIAAELGVHVQTVQRAFRTGSLPGRKVGKAWRTTRVAFEHWLAGGPVPVPLDDTTAATALEQPAVRLETKTTGG